MTLLLMGAGSAVDAAGAAASTQTWDPAFKVATLGLSVDKLTATKGTSNNVNTEKATGAGITVPTFWEITMLAYPQADSEVYGVCDGVAANNMDLGQTSHGAGYATNGAKYAGAGSIGSLGYNPSANGSPVYTALLAWIPATHTLHHYTAAGGWDNGSGDPVADTGGMITVGMIGVAVYPAIELYANGAQASVNFGAAAWVNTTQVANLLANGFVPYT